MKKSFIRLIIVGGIMLLGVGYLLYSSMDSSMVYYYTVDEVLNSNQDFSGRGTRISGWVRPESVRLSENGKGVRFEVSDKESGSTMKVIYNGIVPDTFKEDSEVVVEGTWNSSTHTFSASVLLAKCPSRYEGRGDSHPQDVSRIKDEAAE